MKVSRTHLVPLLTIMAGGAIGASLSFSFLAQPRSAQVLVPDLVVVPAMTAVLTPPIGSTRFEVPVRDAIRDPLRRDVEEALLRAEDLVREQHYVESSMKRLAEATGVPDRQTRRHLLFERKDAMLVEVADLEWEIRRLTAEARADQREASYRLSEAGRTIENDGLKERLRRSRGLMEPDYSREFEAETSRIVEELQEELESASETLQVRWIRVNLQGLRGLSPEEWQQGGTFTKAQPR